MEQVPSSLGIAMQAALDSLLIKAVSQIPATVTSLPDTLQLGTRAQILSGTVLPQIPGNPAGQATIQTGAGPITVSLADPSVALPKGVVNLVLQSGNPPAATIFVPASSQPVQAAPLAIASQAAVQQSVQAAAEAPLPPLAVGQVVTAIVLPALSPALGDQQPATSAAMPAIPTAFAGSGTAAPLPSGTVLQSAVAPIQAGSSSSAPADYPQAEELVSPAGLTPPATLPQATQQFVILAITANAGPAGTPTANNPVPDVAVPGTLSATGVATSASNTPVEAIPAAATSTQAAPAGAAPAGAAPAGAAPAGAAPIVATVVAATMSGASCNWRPLRRR